MATKLRPRGQFFANLGATSSKTRCKSIQEGRLEGLAQRLTKIWEDLRRPKARPKLPRGRKTPPKQFPKGVQETPKRVPKTIFECLNSFEMRLSRKCKNHQKCCKVLQDSRLGGSKSHQKLSLKSILTTKMDPIDFILVKLRATASKNDSKNVQESKYRGTQAYFGQR